MFNPKSNTLICYYSFKLLNRILLLFMVPFIQSSQAQKVSFCNLRHDYIWILGDKDIDTITVDEYGGTEIDFNTMPVSIKLHPKNVEVPFQNCSMCSPSGELIYYSNGCHVLNSNDEIMDGGGEINPGEIHDNLCSNGGYYPGFQNMISIPDSYNDSIYYLLHISQHLNTTPNPKYIIQYKYLYFTTINIYLNNGLGKVISRNNVILADTGLIGTPLTAVKAANGLDWWIITSDRWSNGYYIIKLTQNGFQEATKQLIGIPTDIDAEGGQGKFSPDGKYYAWYHPKNNLFLFQFDRENGTLFDFRLITIPYGNFITGGCEFSPSGRFLYVNNDTSLFQLDLEAEDVQESIVHIADYDHFGDPLPTGFLYMERTPDTRIVLNVYNGSRFLHVIQKPDLKGVNCQFKQHIIKLPTINNFTLPHFPNYRLGATDDVPCDTTMVTIDEIKGNNHLSLFPNPTNNYLYLENSVNVDKINHIQIIEPIGNIVLTTDNFPINLSNLFNGIYFINILFDKNEVFTYKIIKY